MRKTVVIFILSCGLAAVVIIAAVFAIASSTTYRPLASVGVADGRLFHVEGVSYGTNHVIGARSPIVDRFGRWLPQKLPQVQRVGDLEILLANLTMRTNGGPENYWETACRFWDPKWELRKDGTNAPGWDDAEWMVEDDTGNRSHFLGVHQPVLRFSAMFYPSSTNRDAALLLTNSPPASLSNFQSIIWWSIVARAGTNEAVLLGLFPSGTHVFSEGIYQTNPPVTIGPVQGGARSGWIGQSQRLSPFRVKHWHGHYTPSPVIYLRAPRLPNDQRWGVRLRDEKGGLWLAKPEPQKGADGILPFLIDLPPDVETVVAELVVLRPLRAGFDVATPDRGKP